MSPLDARQLGQIRDARRDQIKSAALVVFARRGLAGTKMGMIAEEAKVSHGLFYRYFRSKEELYAVLVEELLEEAARELAQLEQLRGTPAAQLELLTANMLDARHRTSFRFIHHARTSEKAPKKVKQALERASPMALVEQLVPLFRRGQRSGELVAGDPRRLLAWYFTVIQSLLIADHVDEAHGHPSAAMLMRMIRA
jgi:AcrR family transcriptional regulator